MTPDQKALLDRLTAVLNADPRVRSLWLGGSFGRDEGDPFSDVDVVVETDEADTAACVADYGGADSALGQAAWRRTLYGRVVASVTPEWERHDLTFLTTSELARYGGLKPLTAGAKHPDEQRAAPSRPAPIEAEEFLRVLGLLPVAVGREEWLVGQEGAGLLRKMLIDLMVEANGKSGARGGVKRLNPFLTADQRAALEAIPYPGANRQSHIDSSVALARLYLPLGRQVLGAAWPEAFEAATREHLKRALDIDL
jgi:hypothetical protein